MLLRSLHVPRSRDIAAVLCALVAQNIFGAQPSTHVAATHAKVYAEPGRFGGWPANHGIWSWDDEILVGFSAGYFKDNGPGRHAIDHYKPEEHLLARSRDGGVTWTIENPAEHGALIPVGKALHGITPPGLQEPPWQDCPGGINFMDPNFAMTIRMTDVDAGASRFYYSTDRGHTWRGPFRLPLFDQPGIAARTDYLVNGEHDCLLFLTAAKRDGQEGRPLCVRTTDGGKSWQFVAWIGDEPQGYAIMPSTVRLARTNYYRPFAAETATEVGLIRIVRSILARAWSLRSNCRSRFGRRQSAQFDSPPGWSTMLNLRLSS